MAKPFRNIMEISGNPGSGVDYHNRLSTGITTLSCAQHIGIVRLKKIKLVWIPRLSESKLVPEIKDYKSESDWRDVDHVTHRVPVGLYKYFC